MRQRKHEAPEIGAMARRVTRSLVVRAQEGDPEALEQLASLAVEVNDAIANAARGLHDRGHSWTWVGGVLGITRQAARQRFSR